MLNQAAPHKRRVGTLRFGIPESPPLVLYLFYGNLKPVNIVIKQQKTPIMSVRDDFNDAADEWFALSPGTFPGVPRPDGPALIAVRAPVDLPVLETPGFLKRADAVKAALLILSQSPAARELARIAIDAGYSINVDPPAMSGAGPEYEDGSFGNTDHANRRINLRGSDDPLQMAMVIAHELAHVGQIIEGGLDIHVSALHPLAAIRQLLAMEGDARAHEFLVAYELSHAMKDDPGERLLFPQMLAVAADTIGVSMAKRVIELAKPALEQGGAPEEWMARVFKSFYASPSLRDHYENTILYSLENFAAADPETLRDPALFQGEMPQPELRARLETRHPYLSACGENYIDLDQPQMCAVSERTRQRLADFEALRHANPQTQGDKSWRGPVYQLLPAARPTSPPAPPKP